MISANSIEEIVKYQQELLNHQRSQKLIQKETIKYLAALNKNITLMLNRLDEFSTKTNIKLDDSSNNQIHIDDINTNDNTNYLTNNINNNNNLNSTTTSFTFHECSTQLSSNQINLHHINTNITNNNNNNKNINNSLANTSINTISNNSIASNEQTNNHQNIKEYYLLTDCHIEGQHGDGNGSSDEEKETIQAKKKPKTVSLVVTPVNPITPPVTKTKDIEESNNQQRLFNKYVRESVEKRLGKKFLLLHEIQEIDHNIMEEIKRDALLKYPPINIRPRRAWHLAKASLRCRRRSLRRQKERQIQSMSNSIDDEDNIVNPTPTETTNTNNNNLIIVNNLNASSVK